MQRLSSHNRIFQNFRDCIELGVILTVFTIFVQSLVFQEQGLYYFIKIFTMELRIKIKQNMIKGNFLLYWHNERPFPPDPLKKQEIVDSLD